MKNSLSSRLRFAALHDCETKWKQCGAPKNIKKLKGKIDRCYHCQRRCRARKRGHWGRLAVANARVSERAVASVRALATVA